MNTYVASRHPENINISHNKHQEVIEGHKNTASQLVAAAAHHLKAAHYLQEGDYEKAIQQAQMAMDYLNSATNIKREELKIEELSNLIMI